MGKFNVTLHTGKFYDPEKIELLVGEEAIVDFVEHKEDHRFVSYDDKLLDIDAKPFTAKIKALTVGDTELQIQDMKRVTVAFLPISIKTNIWPDQAVDLGATVGKRPVTT